MKKDQCVIICTRLSLVCGCVWIRFILSTIKYKSDIRCQQYHFIMIPFYCSDCTQLCIHFLVSYIYIVSHVRKCRQEENVLSFEHITWMGKKSKSVYQTGWMCATHICISIYTIYKSTNDPAQHITNISFSTLVF